MGRYRKISRSLEARVQTAIDYSLISQSTIRFYQLLWIIQAVFGMMEGKTERGRPQRE